MTESKQTPDPYHFSDKDLSDPEMVKVTFIQCSPSLVGSDMYTYGPFNKGEVLRIPRPNAEILAREGVIEYNENIGEKKDTNEVTQEKETQQEKEKEEKERRDKKPEEVDTVNFSKFTVYPAKIMITGSRSIQNREWVSDHLTYITRQYNIACFVVGDADGVDALVTQYGKENNIPVQVRPAYWDLYGHGAGPIRNTWMVEECDFGFGLWDGRSQGTKDALEKLKDAGKLRTVFLYKESVDDLFREDYTSKETHESPQKEKEDQTVKTQKEKEPQREKEPQKEIKDKDTPNPKEEREEKEEREVRKVHPQWTIGEFIRSRMEDG